MLTLPPLSLYVHFPWCVRKCPYCDFNSHQAKGAIPEQAYLHTLLQDLDNDLQYTQGRKIHSIFFGGGTPSLMSPAIVATLLDNLEQHIGFENGIEITLEANPGTVDQARFQGFSAAGVNRLSIGIQSFDNQQLQKLGRIHDRANAISAVKAAKAAGFDNFNLDLMHGLPAQTTDQALADITLAVNLEPTHISWYQLTLEPNTVFYKQPPPLPDDDILAETHLRGLETLALSGFKQYEVSAFCRSGYPSRHNLNYWMFGDYLGIGAGAHGKITLPIENRIIRTSKTRAPDDYLDRKGNWFANNAAIPKEDLALEFLMNALRLNEGIAADQFLLKTGLPLSAITKTWAQLQKKGLVEQPTKRLTTTENGFLFLNDVLAAFT